AESAITGLLRGWRLLWQLRFQLFDPLLYVTAILVFRFRRILFEVQPIIPQRVAGISQLMIVDDRETIIMERYGFKLKTAQVTRCGSRWLVRKVMQVGFASIIEGGIGRNGNFQHLVHTG